MISKSIIQLIGVICKKKRCFAIKSRMRAADGNKLKVVNITIAIMHFYQ